MNLRGEIFGRLKYLRRARSLAVMAFCCCICVNGFAQLVYLTDSRSVSGSASIETNGPPYYVISYSGYSGSAAPSAPFADFQGSASGTATLVSGILFTNPNTGQLLPPTTNTATVNAFQNSFLHSGELYFNSTEHGSASETANGWIAQGSSSLQVTFSVSAPVAYNLGVLGLGDPSASYDSYNLSSANQGMLVNGNTGTMEQAEDYGNRLNYSGTFSPGDVYTLTLGSGGGDGGGPGYFNTFGDGGGLLVDLTVPEPSTTALAGLAFLILIVRARRIGQRT